MTVRRGAVLGVLGGSFDPPHLGHVLLPTWLRARALVERLWVVPTADHPFGKRSSPLTSRLAWTRLAMQPHGAFVEVSDLEEQLLHEHGGPSFTLRLLEAVQRLHPHARVRLVIGSDIVARGETAKWHRWDQIEARFPPIVVPRAGYADPRACALPEISSTSIREALAAGRWDEIETSVPASVVEALRRGVRGKIWLIGRGHVAAHVEPWLRGRGWQVHTLGARTLGQEPLPSEAPDGVWLLVSDPALGEVARRLASLDPPLCTSTPILHAAGALVAREALAALPRHPVGTLHPICSLRKERVWPSWLDQAGFGIEGDQAARSLATSLVGEQPWLDLQGLSASGRRTYHAACALAANHICVLLSASADVLTGQGHDPDRVERALDVLLRSSLDNLLSLGIPAGLTGPVARGDRAAVQAHISSLDPGTAELYRVLSSRLERIASGQAGDVSPQDDV